MHPGDARGGSGMAGASRVWLQPLWQMGQPAPEDATVAETARDGEEPLKKKKRGKRGGRNGSDREAEKRQRRAIGDGE